MIRMMVKMAGVEMKEGLSKLERKMVYQSLMYIFQIIFLSHAVFIGGFMANLYDRVIEKKETLAYCMYYFVIFDHGLSRMVKLLNQLLNSGEEIGRAHV